METGVLGRPQDHLESVWTRGFSPEQQCMPLGPHSQVHKSIQGEILTTTQGLSKMLESGGELGSRDPLDRQGKASQFGGGVRGTSWKSATRGTGKWEHGKLKG